MNNTPEKKKLTTAITGLNSKRCFVENFECYSYPNSYRKGTTQTLVITEYQRHQYILIQFLLLIRECRRSFRTNTECIHFNKQV